MICMKMVIVEVIPRQWTFHWKKWIFPVTGLTHEFLQYPESRLSTENHIPGFTSTQSSSKESSNMLSLITKGLRWRLSTTTRCVLVKTKESGSMTVEGLSTSYMHPNCMYLIISFQQIVVRDNAHLRRRRVKGDEQNSSSSRASTVRISFQIQMRAMSTSL